MKNILLIGLILLIAGCNLNSEAEAVTTNFDGKRIWVFGDRSKPITTTAVYRKSSIKA